MMSSSFNHNDHREQHQQQQQQQHDRDEPSPHRHHCRNIPDAGRVAPISHVDEEEWFELQRDMKETGEAEWELLQTLVSSYDNIHRSYRGVQETNEGVQTSNENLIESFERYLMRENNDDDDDSTSELDRRRNFQELFESNRAVQESNYRVQEAHEDVSNAFQNHYNNLQIRMKRRKKINKDRREILMRMHHIRACLEAIPRSVDQPNNTNKRQQQQQS